MHTASLNPIPGKIGVYAGKSLSYYWTQYLATSLQHNDFTPFFEKFTNNDKDFLATYVAYKLNLKGPCVTIQTACSSALVAVDEACRSLKEGQCDVAIAGGVALQLPQETGYLYEEDTIMSSDGHCRSFDAKLRVPSSAVAPAWWS